MNRTWLFGIAALVPALIAGPGVADEPESEDVRAGASRQSFHVAHRHGVKLFSYSGKTPPEERILPAAPESFPKISEKTELADAPEVGLFGSLPISAAKTRPTSDDASITAMEFEFAKINYFNRQKTDGFLKALLPKRPDLAGLPFRMGLDCRLDTDSAEHFGSVLRSLSDRDAAESLKENMARPLAAALIQTQGARNDQLELVKRLGAVPHAEATRALAKIALFSPDESARFLAARRLKVRRDQDYTDLLVAGLRYPWPTVARRAAEAIVRLERKDLAARLVETLEADDPRLAQSGEVRELVRINHHRNCLLCHPPAFSNVLLKVTDEERPVEQMEKAADKMAEQRNPLHAPVALPDRAFDNAKPYDRGPEMDDILVRVDATYLRQDFSMMLPVENAAPWPDFQRFDFLVRTRPVTPAEATTLRERIDREKSGLGISPYHRAALFGLREMTGREATTAAEWRRLLKL